MMCVSCDCHVTFHERFSGRAVHLHLGGHWLEHMIVCVGPLLEERRREGWRGRRERGGGGREGEEGGGRGRIEIWTEGSTILAE